MVMRFLTALLLVLAAVGSAAGQAANRQGQVQVITSASHVAFVGLSGGYKTANITFTANTSFSGTMKPVCAFNAGTSPVWEESADFRFTQRSDGEGTVTASLVDGDVTGTFGIECGGRAAVWAGARPNPYASGSVTGQAVATGTDRPAVLLQALSGGVPTLVTFEVVNGILSLPISQSHVWATQGQNRKSCTTADPGWVLLNALNARSAINGGGAAFIRVEIPSGLTGGVKAERRNDDTLPWAGVRLVRHDGVIIPAGTEITSFPFVGYVHPDDLGGLEYSLLASTVVSGSTAACMVLSTGTGVTAVAPRGVEWTEQKEESSSQSKFSIRAAPGTGLALYIESIRVRCGSATAVNVIFEEDDPTTDIVRHKYYCNGVGTGDNVEFKPALKLGANRAFLFSNTAAQAVFWSVSGHTAP
jgi:hypothetical protein